MASAGDLSELNLLALQRYSWHEDCQVMRFRNLSNTFKYSEFGMVTPVHPEEVGHDHVQTKNCFVSKTISIVMQYKTVSYCSSPIVRLA